MKKLNNDILEQKLAKGIRELDNKEGADFLTFLNKVSESRIERTNDWWEDKKFIQELDNRYQALEKGADKGYTLQQLQQSVDKLRTKKYPIA